MSQLYRSLEVASQYKDRSFHGTMEEYQRLLATSTTLYVGNLSFHTTEEQLWEVFSFAGEVRKLIMGLDAKKKTPCGFCFVEYYTHDDASKAVQWINGIKVDERAVRVDWDYGFVEGRQFGRGKTGGQIRDEWREDYDAGRGGYGSLYKQEASTTSTPAAVAVALPLQAGSAAAAAKTQGKPSKDGNDDEALVLVVDGDQDVTRKRIREEGNGNADVVVVVGTSGDEKSQAHHHDHDNDAGEKKRRAADDDDDNDEEVEPLVRQEWNRSRADATPATVTAGSPRKRYILSMFPYPSGALHMGHVRVYALSDALARFHRLCGKDVLHPMGWDAFGLPAENAARDRGISPADWTHKNIAHMKGQLQSLGFSFDWEREVTTCNPSYFKGTQELWVELYRRGLVYQKEALVNWDPVDKTVLANEQVDRNGCSWRSGAVVEQRMLRQWFIRITDYSERLLKSLDSDSMVAGWPEQVRKMQQQWIQQPMHDWLVSRQRPWGTPIPMVYCKSCGPEPVLDTRLPVVESGTPCDCPKCGAAGARRESDTLDTFVDSSWYYLAYARPAGQTDDPWMPVDVYVGGIEHAVLHLLYARFVSFVLCNREPFTRLLVQGMVQNRTWRIAGSGVPVPRADVDEARQVLLRDPAVRVESTWEKMSKSKFNGVEPADMLERHGADATRLFVLFRAPPTMALEWDDAGVLGMARWLQRLWQLCQVSTTGHQPPDGALSKALDESITRVTLATGEKFLFNTAIAQLMSLSNMLRRHKSTESVTWRLARKQLIVMLMPYAPHFAHHVWPLVCDSPGETPQWPSVHDQNTEGPKHTA